MKKSFSTKWKASKLPRKQRKYRAKAPLHIKENFVRSSLSKQLREKTGKRSVRVVKGDKIKILTGDYKGKQGKVERVSVKLSKVYIDVASKQKADGSKSYYPMDASNVIVIELNDKDKKRFAKQSKDSKKSKENKDKKQDVKHDKPESKAENNKVKENKVTKEVKGEQ